MPKFRVHFRYLMSVFLALFFKISQFLIVWGMFSEYETRCQFRYPVCLGLINPLYPPYLGMIWDVPSFLFRGDVHTQLVTVNVLWTYVGM